MRKIFITICIIATLSTSLAYTEDENVLVLTEKDFPNALIDFPQMLVEFYAPWCGHCKKLFPEFQRAAAAFKKKGSPIRFAKVDATTEKELATKYHVKSYPTISWFENGESYDYDGGRTETTIIDWVRFKAEPVSNELDDPAVIDNNLAKGNLVFVFWGGQLDPDYKTFEKVSKKFREHPSFHVSSTEMKSKLGISSNVKFSLYKAFEERKLDFTQEFTEDTLTKFLDKYSKPLVNFFSQALSKKIFGDRNTDALILFRRPDIDPQILKEMKLAGEELAGKILLVDVDVSLEIGEKAFKAFGNKDLVLPLLTIVHFNQKKEIERYVTRDKINKNTIIQFYENYKHGNLSKYYKSEVVSQTNDGPVKKVVGDNFKSVVLDPSKDVFLFFHAPWDTHSTNFHPIFDSLAQKFSSNKNLVFAKTDATLNEYEGVQITSYPTLMFYPAKQKGSPSVFNGDRTEEEIANWLKPFLSAKSNTDL